MFQYIVELPNKSSVSLVFERVPALSQMLCRCGLPAYASVWEGSRRIWAFHETRGEEVMFLRVLLPLLGGKGGFGSLLKGSKSTSGKSTNVNSSKDLEGRRIRQMNQEQALEEWKKKAESTSKLTPAQIQHKFQLIKAGKFEKLEMCRYSSECRYQQTCPFDHPEKSGKSEKPEKPAHESKKAVSDLDTARKLVERGMKRNRIQQEVTKPSKQLVVALNKNKFTEIDLESVEESAQLECYGMEHLKGELSSRGLKCGGSLSERASRLFLLKNSSLAEIPAKYKARCPAAASVRTVQDARIKKLMGCITKPEYQ